MNLPPPFEKASDVRATLEGSINLIDQQGKSLVQIPLTTAFELSAKIDGYGDGDVRRNSDGSGFGYGNGLSYGYGHWVGSGTGYGFATGYGRAEVDGSGRGKIK